MLRREHASKLITFLLVLCAVLVLATAACAPQEGRDTSQNANTVSGAIEPWSPTVDCSMCHTIQSQSFDDPTLRASTHSASTCIDCHSNETELAQIHEGATAAPTTSSRNVYTMASTTTCIGTCHNVDDLAKKTEDSITLVDLDGVVINPHDVPKSSGHLKDSTECYNCHTIHTKEAPDGQYCRDCHHTNYFSTCKQCHD